MSFKDIKGHDRIIELIRSSIEKDRVSHAYIFTGPGGVGKRLVALEFAKALNCVGSSSRKPVNGCDICVSCKRIDALGHPDIMVMTPAKDCAPIKIDDIRHLIKSINMKPYEAKKKVYIIDDAGSMGPEAQNALLKTMEEPPPDSVIILITDNISRLFDTIISRSQILKFFAIAIEDVKEILNRSKGMDQTRAHIISHLSLGRPGEAIRLNESGLFEKRSRLIQSLADGTFFESDFDGVPKTDLKLYLSIMLSWYRDILVTKTGLDPATSLINIDKKEIIAQEADRLDFKKLYKTVDQIISTGSFLEQNANPKLAMSVLGLNISSGGEPAVIEGASCTK